jgi:hypothetical protein
MTDGFTLSCYKIKMATSERRHVCAGSPTAQGKINFPEQFQSSKRAYPLFCSRLPEKFPKNFSPLYSQQ